MINYLIAVVHQHEEQVEARHDGRRHLNVVLERLGLVVAAYNYG